MSDYTLQDFVSDCQTCISAATSAAECVDTTAQHMFSRLNGRRTFLREEHYRSDAEHYTRNAIYVEPNGLFSLYAR
jgi:hypothetical protein